MKQLSNTSQSSDYDTDSSQSSQSGQADLPATYKTKLADHQVAPRQQQQPQPQQQQQQLAASDRSPIERFFEGRTILVTGGSGFIGKILLEKLLRCYPGIRHIYLLLRTKRNQSPHERLQSSIFNVALFDTLQQMDPSRLAKVSVIPGDIGQPKLGICPEDERRLIEANVSVIFHSAATVKFDEPLKTSVAMNLIATRNMIELARKLPNLVSLCHVSTAYANSDITESAIEERIYDMPEDPAHIINMAQWMDESTMQILKPTFLRNRPNTYTYTKALAETLISREARDLPVAIVRPSIVVATWCSPIRGWVDNLNGPTGLLLAIGKGLLRTLWVKKEAKADLIPADVCINLMIAAAWKRSVEHKTRENAHKTHEPEANDLSLAPPPPPPVYHCTSGELNPITWGQMETIFLPIIQLYPSIQVLRYPNGSFKQYKYVDLIYRLFAHYLPALLVDVLCLCTGNKRIMFAIYDKIHNAVAQLNTFCITDWTFKSQNMLTLYKELDPRDQATLPMDIRQLHWPTYFLDYLLGARTHVLKEKAGTLPEARKSLNRAYYIDMGVTVMMLAMLWYFFGSTLTNFFYNGSTKMAHRASTNGAHAMTGSVWSRPSSAFVDDLFPVGGASGTTSQRLLKLTGDAEPALMGAR